MQFKKSAVFGVLIMLYLSTDSWCHYIPEKKTATTTTNTKKNNNSSSSSSSSNSSSSSQSQQIQICGNALTNFVIEACDGILGSFNQGNSKRNSVQTKITEDCCDHECPLDYLQTYCGEAPLFTTKKTLRGKLLNKLLRTRGGSSGAPEGQDRRDDGDKKKGGSEVSVVKRKRVKSRKKRKKAFKWKCAYKSFGHYLLGLDRRGGGRHGAAKGPNSINRTWPSIELGTISPEIEKFGGQPIVVVKKNKSNSS